MVACHVVGLDQGLGIIHNDARGRQSLALDLLEPVRPAVDAFVLDLLEHRAFRKSDFTETADGHCRLLAPLTHELAETLPQWSRAVAPVAEQVAHALGRAMTGKYVPVTPLTRRGSRQAQAVVKARRAVRQALPTANRSRQRPAVEAAPTLWTCPDCGGPVTDSRRVRCDACIAADPRQTPEARSRRGAAIAARKRALREWDQANPGIEYDPDCFRREVLPCLATVKLADIMAAAGISKGYASNVRAGKFTPHVSTWSALAALAATSFGA